MIDNNAVANRIKQIRLKHGWTLEELGERLNASKVSVHNWESGKNLPNKKRLKQIADLGEVTVEHLLYGDIENFASYTFNNELESYIEEMKGKENSIYITQYFNIEEASFEFSDWLTSNSIHLNFDEKKIRKKAREVINKNIEKNKLMKSKSEDEVLKDAAYKILNVSNDLKLEYFELKKNNGEEQLTIKEGFHEAAFETVHSVIIEAGAKILNLNNTLQENRREDSLDD